MKSVQFKRLLPEIYQKIIIENFTHQQASEWLLKEHNLDLMGRNQDAKPFSNYLSVYGAIKTAKNSYAVNVDNPEHVAEHWYRKFTDTNKTKTTKPIEPIGVKSSQSNTQDVVAGKSVPSSKLRQADKYRNNPHTKLSVEDVLSDYDNKL